MRERLPPRLPLAVALAAGWAAVGGACLAAFLRGGQALWGALAAFVLWPGQLADFYLPDPRLPGLRTLLFILATLAWSVLVLLPLWHPRLTSPVWRRRLLLVTGLLHLLLSLAIAARTRQLFEIARVVRDL